MTDSQLTLFPDSEEAEKQCVRCGVAFPLSGFYLDNKGDRPRTICKGCHRAGNRKRYHEKYKADPEYKAGRRKYGAVYYRENRERRSKEISLTHRKEREECLQAYGGKCACCGESRYEFLALDHVNGGGEKHRLSCGGKMSRWLKRHGFPNDPPIRVLCHNCNMAMGFYGRCPHENERTQP